MKRASSSAWSGSLPIASCYVDPEQGREKRFPAAHFDSLTATSLKPTKKSSTYLCGYVSGFFVVSASFRLNSQNARDGTFFHHPASYFSQSHRVDLK
jgi:hypothetical protein